MIVKGFNPSAMAALPAKTGRNEVFGADPRGSLAS
jgi:hypothetical protein